MERHLQQCLNKLDKWANANGFKLSKTKTICLHFCQLRGLHPDLTLFLVKAPIPVVKEFKFFGLLLDPNLTFFLHIRYPCVKCNKSFAFSKFCSVQTGVLIVIFYLCYIRPLFYPNMTTAVSLAVLSDLHILDLMKVHVYVFGAYRTLPVDSLYIESNEPSLSFRRTQLSLAYATKMSSFPTNPAYDCVFHENLYVHHQRFIPLIEAAKI
ncbi:hypothetical protein, partial [Solemya velum gill symbiont]|uniref:hypothetical protein n=1 Tax=Solemya velum gill symbiont TaxID=2340 RepID=UPI001C4E0C5F